MSSCCIFITYLGHIYINAYIASANCYKALLKGIYYLGGLIGSEDYSKNSEIDHQDIIKLQVPFVFFLHMMQTFILIHITPLARGCVITFFNNVFCITCLRLFTV